MNPSEEVGSKFNDGNDVGESPVGISGGYSAKFYDKLEIFKVLAKTDYVQGSLRFFLDTIDEVYERLNK